MQKITRAVLLFVFLLLLYTLLRFVFYQMYFKNSNLSWAQLRLVIYWGWREDFSGIFYANLGFFIYYFLLYDILFARKKKLLAIILLSVINLPLLAINFIDLAYYKFNLRRSTVDLFGVVHDSMPALGAFVKTWWWLFVLFFILAVVTVLVFSRILKNSFASKNSYLKANIFPCLFFLLPAGLLARGWSDRPIIPSTPLLYLPTQYQPLATNSTITILYSLVRKHTSLKEKKYFTSAGLDTLFNAKRQLNSSVPLKKMNVVVFILESFAKEYIDKTDPLHAQTPFLDSIMAESIVCNKAYANGTESNKGLVAVLGSIPPFFDEPFYYSSYSNNKIRGIGTLLKEEGYKPSFFMGAGYDHFGFTKFSKMIGFDNYYSMNDYGDKRHYNGSWGISDHYFLPYAAREMKKVQKPFLSAIFTLSTHYPYTIPDTLKKQFTIRGQGAEQNSMSYLDYSLRLFFETIQKESWYTNTLFVFTADHNLFWHLEEKATLYKALRIPIFFHMPGSRQHVEINSPVQQMDIVPSVLNILQYDKPFMSFGKSVFDTISPAVAISHFGNLYQAIDSAYLYGYNEKAEQPAYLYNFQLDPALKKNLLVNGHLPDQHSIKLQQHLKAVIQYFNNSMIENKLYIK